MSIFFRVTNAQRGANPQIRFSGQSGAVQRFTTVWAEDEPLQALIERIIFRRNRGTVNTIDFEGENLLVRFQAGIRDSNQCEWLLRYFRRITQQNRDFQIHLRFVVSPQAWNAFAGNDWRQSFPQLANADGVNISLRQSGAAQTQAVFRTQPRIPVN